VIVLKLSQIVVHMQKGFNLSFLFNRTMRKMVNRWEKRKMMCWRWNQSIVSVCYVNLTM